jgi:hypothetical protein
MLIAFNELAKGGALDLYICCLNRGAVVAERRTQSVFAGKITSRSVIDPGPFGLRDR